MSELRIWIENNAALLLLIGVCIVFGAFLAIRTDGFLTWKNMVNILEANSYRMLLALGMMLVISSGAIDLSVGSILSLSGVIMAWLLVNGCAVWLSIVLGLLAGTLLGALNGLVISATRINAFIITLATAFLYRGLSLIITKGNPITRLPQAFRTFGYGDVFGMEAGVTMAVLAILIIAPLFYRTRWGVYLTGLGGNPEAVRRCGISPWKYRISVFAVAGLLAAVAGLIITARLNSAETNAGLNMEMDAICAVILGGTPLYGGRGSIAGTVVAVFLLGMIRNGLTLLSVSPYYQTFITGAILLVAVVFAELRERKQRLAG